MTENTSPRPAFYHRLVHHHTDGHPISVMGPLGNGTYDVFDYSTHRYAGRFERADDAIDLLMELAYS